MGMEKFEDISTWCQEHDAVADVDLPSPVKPPAVAKEMPKPPAEVLVEIVKDVSKAGIPSSQIEIAAVEPSVKKSKTSKKEESDPSSGSE